MCSKMVDLLFVNIKKNIVDAKMLPAHPPLSIYTYTQTLFTHFRVVYYKLFRNSTCYFSFTVTRTHKFKATVLFYHPLY